MKLCTCQLEDTAVDGPCDRRRLTITAQIPKSLARHNKTLMQEFAYSRRAAQLIGRCDGSIHPAGTCMTRDGLMFWLSLAWLIFLCGMATWILFAS